MKDRIAENARVMRSGDGMAHVRMEGGHTCHKCGMAAMGLCKPGGTGMEMTVRDPIGTKPGDLVRLGLDASTERRGFVAAYVLPLFCFVLGSFVGWWAGRALGVPGLDVATGVVALGGGLLAGRRTLRRLQGSARMHVTRTVTDVPEFDPVTCGPEEADYLNAWPDHAAGGAPDPR
jgi:positive regulator of sigma E activity